ncbi:hypothetical protein Efla_006716 [Eimeria flavescens]
MHANERDSSSSSRGDDQQQEQQQREQQQQHVVAGMTAAVAAAAAESEQQQQQHSSSSSCCCSCCRLGVAAGSLKWLQLREDASTRQQQQQLLQEGSERPAASPAAAALAAAAAAAGGEMGLVSDFYRGQTVLLTGASGFVGKVVLARLLQHCECKKIYVLLRPLRTGTAEDRLRTSVLSSGVFDELREQHGAAAFLSFASQKVEALAGDLLQPDLGMQEAARVQREVSVVIHMAASVHFNSPLKDNYRSNVEGSLRVLDFACKCRNLQVFIHTSTCYVNSDLRGRVKEGIIPLPWDTDDLHLAVTRLIDIADKGEADNYEALEKQLLGRFPNTYAFTKRLGEALIAREWQLRNGPGAAAATQQQQQRSLLSANMRPLHFPICILRPSIIGCAYKHPKRGWIDNVNATGGMLLLCALGILKCLPANPELIGDQVPVDVVADALVVCGAAVAASHAALKRKHRAAAAAAPAVAADAAAAAPRADPTVVAATEAAAAHVDPSCMLYPVQVPPLKHQTPAAAAAAAAAAAPAVAPLGAPDPEEAAAAAAAAGRPGIYVVHSCTSDINPTYWRDLLIHGREYNMLCPYYSRIRRHLQTPFFDTDFKQFRRRFFLEQKLPGAVLSSVSSALLPASSRTSRGLSLLYSGLVKAEKVAEALHHFSYQEWIFEQQNLPKMQQMLDATERQKWFIGVEDINWREYIHFFFYGIARWLLQEPSACEPPPPPKIYMDALQRYLISTPLTPPTLSLPTPSALHFVLAAPPLRVPPDPEAVEHAVLQQGSVLEAVDRLAKSRQEKRKRRGRREQPIEDAKREALAEARCMYTSIAGCIQQHAVLLLAGLFHRAYSCLFDRIIVEETQMQQLKRAVQTASGPVMLLPTHRSYLDFLLISFVCFTYGVPLPFIAADEAFGTISMVHRILRRCGAFFVCRGGPQRAGGGDPQESSALHALRTCLLREYVKSIARRYGVFELFLEGGRSKTGLLLPPKRGILANVLDVLFTGPALDVTLVPISISYDKVLEAETFPQELLGQPKKAEALSRVLKATKLLADRSYHQELRAGPGSRGLTPQFGPGYRPLGTASINVLDPISFKEYLFNTWGGEASLQPLLGALRHCAASPLARFHNMPEVSGQPRLLSPEDARKPENQMPQQQLEQLPTKTTSYGVMKASGNLPKIPEDVKRKLIVGICDRVMDTLSEGLYVTPTSLVATILAMHRDGIREEDLVAQVAWLRDELVARGGRLSPCVGGFSYDPSACVKTVLGRYLNSIAEKKGEGWTVTSCYEGGGGGEAHGASLRLHLPRLLLAYYRNQSLHVFANEAFVAVALSACGGSAAWKEGATVQDIQTHTGFLLKLLNNHFVYSGKMNEDGVENVVTLMEQRGVLLRRGVGPAVRYALNDKQEALVVLLCSYLWPFVDSLWALGTALFTLQANSSGATKPLDCASPQLTKKQLVARAHWLADGLCNQKILSSCESASFPTLRQGVEGFLSLKVLRSVSSGEGDSASKDVLVELEPKYREEAELQVWHLKRKQHLLSAEAKSVNCKRSAAEKIKL